MHVLRRYSIRSSLQVCASLPRSLARASQAEIMAPKRKDAKADDDKPQKKTKTELHTFDSRWKHQKPSLLYIGDDLEPSDKIAGFDLDGTLIEWKSGVAMFSLDPGSWEWWSKSVPSKLQVQS